MTQQQFNSESVELLSTHFPQRSEPNFAWGNISIFEQLPYLRGFWTFGPRQAQTIFDCGHGGRTLTNTNNYLTLLQGLAPYLDIGGGGGIRRADEAALDIIPAIAMGAWVYCTSFATVPAIISKWGAAGQRAYMLGIDATGHPTLSLTADGTTIITHVHTDALTLNSWYFVAATENGGIEMSVFLNEVGVKTVAGVPAAIFNSNADLELAGATASTANLLTGRLAYPFLCAGWLPDYVVWLLHQLTRPLFGL